MGVFEIDLLDYYFSKQHELLISNPDQNLIEKFFNMEIFAGIQEKYPEIFDPFLKNLSILGERPLQEDLIEYKKEIQKQPRLKSFLIDVVRNSHENVNEMWKTFYFNDEFLFKNLSSMMDCAKKESPRLLLKIIKKFQKNRRKGLSLLQQIQSPLDFAEVKAEARIKLKNNLFTLRDLIIEQWNIIQGLNQKSKQDQEISIHDWCMKLGDLLEVNFKKYMYFIFLTNELISTGILYISRKKLESMSINDVFSTFSSSHNSFENISKLRHIRNSIHHGDFTWQISQPIEDTNIRFVDRSWTDTLSFEQVLIIYFKVVTLIATFELVVMNIHFSLLDSRPIGHILKDVGNQLFQQFLISIRKWLEEIETEK